MSIMENFLWKSKAEAVLWLDLVVTTYSIWVFGLTLCAGLSDPLRIFIHDDVIYNGATKTPGSYALFLGIFLIGVVVAGSLFAWHYSVLLKLLKKHGQTVDGQTAYEKSGRWSNWIQTFKAVLWTELICNWVLFSGVDFWKMVPITVIRLVMVKYSILFMNELGDFLKGNPSPAPSNDDMSMTPKETGAMKENDTKV